MATYAQREREALATLLGELGPDAPTLCDGWTTRDLAAHIVVRERRPVAAAGIVLKPLQRHGDRVRDKIAAQPYERIIEQVRNPPWWSPVSNRLVDSATNTVELFVHHEDVRRAQPDWRPRDLPAGHQAELWRRTGRIARLVLPRLRASVSVRAPGHGEITAGAGGPKMRLIGAPSELIMFLQGRQSHARVQLDGPPELARRLRTKRLGI